ncbi:MAG: dockerin type I domain-containing protein [Chthoniobacterales bacterium]
MKLSLLWLSGGVLLTAAISTVMAGSRASASYSIPADVADAGGHHASSSNYVTDGSAALVTGISTVASPAETVEHGYIGQLSDGVTLVSVASVKTHGAAGAFGVNLPLVGARGVECRSGGVCGNHTLIFTFGSTLATVSGASVTAGSGSVASSSVGSDSRQYIVNLTGVTNAQTLSVSLTNVTDTNGNSTPTVSIPMGVLLGDVSGNGSVNGTDVSQTKANSGQAVGATTFRADVNVNGSINGTDVAQVKAQAGNVLPP